MVPAAAAGETVAVNVTLAPVAMVELDAVRVVVVAVGVVEFVVAGAEVLQPVQQSAANAIGRNPITP